MPGIRSYNPDIPQSVENIVLKATAKNPAERYQSADDMLMDLQKCLLPQYRDVEKIHIENKLIPVVEVENGHVKVIDYEENKEKKPAKKRKWLNWAIVGLSAVVGLSLVVLIFSITGVISLPAIFGYEQMPAVASLSQQEAIDLLTQSGIDEDNIVIQESLSDSVDEGFVISASIEEGNWLSKNDEIVLTVSKGGSYLINDYTGRYLDDVKKELQEDGVSLTYSINYLGVADTNPGIILEQSLLNPGDRVDPDGNAQIEFTVSQYPSITIDESLIGMDVSEAKEYLNSLGIAVSLVQSGTSGSEVVTDVYPSIGTKYTQSGTDSVVILYYN
jgi:serine/threonine-protein kinase